MCIITKWSRKNFWYEGKNPLRIPECLNNVTYIQVYLLLDKYPEAFLPIGSQVEICYLDKIPSFIFISIFLFHFIRGTPIIRNKDLSIFEVISWELYCGS